MWQPQGGLIPLLRFHLVLIIVTKITEFISLISIVTRTAHRDNICIFVQEHSHQTQFFVWCEVMNKMPQIGSLWPAAGSFPQRILSSLRFHSSIRLVHVLWYVYVVASGNRKYWTTSSYGKDFFFLFVVITTITAQNYLIIWWKPFYVNPLEACWIWMWPT